MEKPSPVESNRLEYLFEVELQNRPGMPVVTSPESKVGKLVASGDGKVKGPRAQGTVRWDLFEDQGETVCRSNLRGVIETTDGAQIQFDTMGFFMRPEKSKPSKWVTSAAVHFDTADKRYEWLKRLLAIWEGDFDMQTGRHFYKVRAPKG